MANKERMQNPVVNDTVILRLFVKRSNIPQDDVLFESIDIYFLDPSNKSCDNPDGRCFIESIDGSEVQTDPDCSGSYFVEVLLERPKYQVGKYLDIWITALDADDPPDTVINQFEIYPNLVSTSPIPPIYDFDFKFQPNRIRKGACQYIVAEVIPVMVNGCDLDRYYQNLAIAPDLTMTIELFCGQCVPADPDLRIILEDEPIDFKEKRIGAFLLNTEELDMSAGIYQVTFKLKFCGNCYISPKMALQIFE